MRWSRIFRLVFSDRYEFLLLRDVRYLESQCYERFISNFQLKIQFSFYEMPFKLSFASVFTKNHFHFQFFSSKVGVKQVFMLKVAISFPDSVFHFFFRFSWPFTLFTFGSWICFRFRCNNNSARFDGNAFLRIFQRFRKVEPTKLIPLFSIKWFFPFSKCRVLKARQPKLNLSNRCASTRISKCSNWLIINCFQES
jgi:hypothetical protein